MGYQMPLFPLLRQHRFLICTVHAVVAQLAAQVAKAEQPAVPVYVALVDVCCGEETLELTRSALQAALEALPPAARFGLVTYSHQVGNGAISCRLPPHDQEHLTLHDACLIAHEASDSGCRQRCRRKAHILAVAFPGVTS